MFHKSPSPDTIGPLEAKVERFRARAILALVLVCGLAAYAMQVFVGIFIERDLAGSFRRLGVFNLIVPAFEIAAALLAVAHPAAADRATRDMAAGRPVSAPGARRGRERPPTRFRAS